MAAQAMLAAASLASSTGLTALAAYAAVEDAGTTRRSILPVVLLVASALSWNAFVGAICVMAGLG